MKKMPTPTVGQVLYSVPTGNRVRAGDEPVFVTVKKVGRKYFTVGPADDDSSHMQSEVHLDTWRQKTDYAPRFRLYPDEQARIDEREANLLYGEFRKAFSVYGDSPFPLEKLKAMHKILFS